MAKKQKLKADTVLKNYWRDSRRFADLFNAVLFEGEEIIKAEELEDADTEESAVLEHGERAESIEAARDSIKIRKASSACGIEYVLLANESQGHIHYAMPMRIMGYEYADYRKQYEANAGKYRKAEGLSRDEYLSKMKATDRFAGVITVVVYYGAEPWNAATTLHGMLDIPERMKPYINDYRMLLVEARENSLKFHNADNADLFSLLKIILDRSLSREEAESRALEYSTRHRPQKAVLMTLAGAAGSRIDYNQFEKGDADMGTLFDEIAKEGEVRGEVIGGAKQIIAMGSELGLNETDILSHLMAKLSITKQTAAEYLNMFGKQTI